MHLAWTVTLHEGIAVSTVTGQAVTFQSPYGLLTLRKCPAAFRPLLERLVFPGVPFQRLAELAFETRVPNPLARLVHYLQFLARRGWVSLSATAEGKRLATLEPMAADFRWPRGDLAEISDGCFVLSRFAYLHREHGRFVLESPLSTSRVVVQDARATAVLFALNRAVSQEDIRQEVSGLSRDACKGLLRLLRVANVLSAVNDAGDAEEADREDLRTWEFHDLLFHSRSRIGRHDAPVGAVYPFFGKTDPPPALEPVAVKTTDDGSTILLVPPDLAAIRKQDPPFADVIERRQSIREFADEPISLSQLSEFLFRTSRIREQFDSEIETPHGLLTMDFTSRPYPAGGALYELEIYPLIQHCQGVDAGLYHYDAAAHQLVRVSEWTQDVQALVDAAGHSTGSRSESIQVLLLVSARFARVAWKYSSMAYALILKHVGVLFQTMYLTATAMELAPCAIGSGNSGQFAKAVGGNYYRESTVGEFLLGTRS